MINGQSGVFMLRDAPPPYMSHAARRICGLSACFAAMLRSPQAGPDFDRKLFDLAWRLRVDAAAYIAASCEDSDALAHASREAAAGRGFFGRSARVAFFRAGVVAPPESPGFGNPSEKEGAAQ